MVSFQGETEAECERCLFACSQVLDHVVELTQDMGLGIIVDDQAKKILDKGAEIKDTRPKKEDIISD